MDSRPGSRVRAANTAARFKVGLDSGLWDGWSCSVYATAGNAAGQDMGSRTVTHCPAVYGLYLLLPETCLCDTACLKVPRIFAESPVMTTYYVKTRFCDPPCWYLAPSTCCFRGMMLLLTVYSCCAG